MMLPDMHDLRNTSATIYELNFSSVRKNRIMKLLGSHVFGSWCFTHHEVQALHHKRAALRQYPRVKLPSKQTKIHHVTFQI